MDFRSFHRLICRVSQLKRGGWSFVQNPSWWDIQKNSQNTSMVWNWCINNISNFEIPFRHIFSSKTNVQMPKKSGKNPASRLASLIWCRKNRRDAASWSITSPPEIDFFHRPRGFNPEDVGCFLEVQLVVSFPSSRLGKTLFSHLGSMETFELLNERNRS